MKSAVAVLALFWLGVVWEAARNYDSDLAAKRLSVNGIRGGAFLVITIEIVLISLLGLMQ